MGDEELDVMIRALPRSIEPPKDGWPRLAERLEAKKRRRKLLPAALVLAAALALLWSKGTRLGTTPEDVLDPPRASPRVGATSLGEPEAFPGERDLELAARELGRAYEHRRTLLESDLLAVYEANLEIVEAAIERSRAALAERPDDDHLQRVLDRTYHQKLTVLRQASNTRAPR